ncbi:hypothetical protein [Methylobacterium sp. NEAU K]|uniref:hypothetical protein n=1 Tax=Methylobacterium sp. NEAU K TaxID=3064946 RepID=UPI0027371F57|nr:hypothetical protein [Methylobacterium sp. NEAU K]MDP4002190.1 hypothetical protein [Methylobacterium sp. NEAU K]
MPRADLDAPARIRPGSTTLRGDPGPSDLITGHADSGLAVRLLRVETAADLRIQRHNGKSAEIAAF